MSKSVQFKTSSKEKVYPNPYWPIGSIYLSVTNTNPSKWFGGKWEQIAKGRTLVGVDTSQSEFSTVKKTGGSKYIQQHSHSGIYFWGQKSRFLTLNGGSSEGFNINSGQGLANDNSLSTGDVAGPVNTGESGNLQPYYTCYIWCRTA